MITPLLYCYSLVVVTQVTYTCVMAPPELLISGSSDYVGECYRQTHDRKCF